MQQLPKLTAIILICFYVCASYGAPKKTDTLGRINFDHTFIQLSQTLDEFRLAMALPKNQTVYLTGGTALSIINHIVFNEPLKMKDFDIALVQPEISKVSAEKLSKKLAQSKRFTEKQVVPKPWGSGWGMFHNHNVSQVLVDVAIFPKLDAILYENGILNTERVKLEISGNNSLLGVAREIEERVNNKPQLSQIHQLPHIVDPDQGFKSWKNKKPKIIKYHELQQLPIISSMRIIRIHAKMQADLSTELSSILSSALDKDKIDYDKIRAARHFSYFFDDPKLAEELKFAHQIGLFRHLLPSLAKFISQSSVEQIRSTFPMAKSTEPTLTEQYRVERMSAIYDLLSANERNDFIDRIKGFYPTLVSTPELTLVCKSLFKTPRSLSLNFRRN